MHCNVSITTLGLQALNHRACLQLKVPNLTLDLPDPKLVV